MRTLFAFLENLPSALKIDSQKFYAEADMQIVDSAKFKQRMSEGINNRN